MCGINWRIVLMFGRFIELMESREVELYFVSALIVIEFILGCGMKRNGECKEGDKALACRTGRFDIGTVLDGIWALFDNKIRSRFRVIQLWIVRLCCMDKIDPCGTRSKDFVVSDENVWE